MTSLTETDFVHFDNFALHWRFAHPRFSKVSSSLKRRIRPLSAQAAGRISADAVTFCEDGTGATLNTIEAAPDYDAVRVWLRALPVPTLTEVLVSWDSETAALTDWDVFVSHWDDFCYPSSDDVTVWSPGGAWSLCYFHYEHLEFRISTRGLTSG